MKKIENHSVVSGLVAFEPRVINVGNGKKVTFTIKIGRRTKKAGENGEKAEYANALKTYFAWLDKEEKLLDVVMKGEIITVEGEDYPENWIDSEGNLQERLNFHATKVYTTPEGTNTEKD